MNELNKRTIDIITDKSLTIWKLGNLEHRIFPSAAACERLKQTIEELDLPGKHVIWGPELDVLKMEF